MKKQIVTMAIAAFAAQAMAASITIPMHIVNDSGASTAVGQINVSESNYGLVFTPALTGLPPGMHGFHVHENASCAAKEKDGKNVPALAAGGHYDPAKSGKHGAPWGDGHLGDLPALYVDADGKASQPVLAPRLKLSDLSARSIMIHAGGDNHADHPMPLGGGGPRIVCGVVP
jgi:Cu-Zn family superoxide dismutase